MLSPIEFNNEGYLLKKLTDNQRRWFGVCEYITSHWYYMHKGLPTSQQVEAERETRSRAREYAALQAYSIVVSHGLWMRLKDAGITPELDSSINQLQELYQKKYISAPTYTFEERPNVGEEWYCSCQTDGVLGWGKAGSKTAAKKKAAFMALVRLFRSAGLVTEASENYQDTVEQG